MHKTLATLFLAAFVACAAIGARAAETATPDDTARFLAGLQPSANSPLAPLANTPEWQQHARRFDSMFAEEEKFSLAKVRAFSKDHLPDKHHSMLYMFSGPDALYAVSLFPTATTYVLVGLEPAGGVPSLTSLTRGTLDASLRNLETSLGTVMTYSFFITKNMKTQLRAGPVFGTLPIIYVFLARTGKTIHDASFVNLDRDGNVVAADDKSKNSAAQGVKIVFSDGSGPNQTLYYFSTNLGDDGVKTSGLLPFLDKLGAADSFVKSASYLMHVGNFSTIRNFLLARSATIVQDDSGIPLAFFDPKKWQLEPYGHYLGPIGEFPSHYQTAMEDLYRKTAPTPIDFGLGYRWRKNESNLLVARKTAPISDESVVNTALTMKSEMFGPPDVSRGGPPPSQRPAPQPFWGGYRLYGPRW
ncbi:MAG TPA: hypothetical protein VH206_20730 [Xanthobacteraceae bacterium]|jgi:hypothetical protein|nr:hypothetical protein [Xanthobacteraceae bacterium]